MIRLRMLRASLIAIAITSCARPPAPADVPVSTPVVNVVSAEYARLADSVQANTPVSALTVVRPPRGMGLPQPPLDVQPGVRVQIGFRIRADGSADLPTLVISGTANKSYRRSIERDLAGVRFEVPELRGCPVPGRGAITQLVLPPPPDMRDSG